MRFCMAFSRRTGTISRISSPLPGTVVPSPLLLGQQVLTRAKRMEEEMLAGGIVTPALVDLQRATMAKKSQFGEVPSCERPHFHRQ